MNSSIWLTTTIHLMRNKEVPFVPCERVDRNWFLVHLSRRRCPSSVRPSSLTFHIFDFSSEAAKRNSTKLDRKQDPNVLYKVCVFRAGRKKQNGRPGLWLAETFLTSLKPLNRIQRNFTGSKISTSSTKFVFFGPIKKQDGRPGLW